MSVTEARGGATFVPSGADLRTRQYIVRARVRTGRPLLMRMQKRAPAPRASKQLARHLFHCRVVVCHVDRKLFKSIAQNTCEREAKGVLIGGLERP